MPIKLATTEDIDAAVAPLRTALDALAVRVKTLETVPVPPSPPPSPPPPPPPPPPVPVPVGVRLFPQTLAAELAHDPAPLYAECDAALPTLVNLGSYQASQLYWIRKFSLAYRHALKQLDAPRADRYGRKVTAIALGGCRNYQKGGWDVRQCLGIGDGTRKRFALPKTPIVPSINVFTSAVVPKAVTRGAGDVDQVDYYNLYLRVTDGAKDYVRGVDWNRAQCGNNQIRWLTENRPAQGTYTIYEAQIISPTRASGWTVEGSEIVFATAPAANQAVIAECVFTDYTQTEALDGGYSNIMVDTGYATRSLQFIPYVLDWCRGHPAVEAARAEIEAQLIEWCDALPSRGYSYNSIQSNYGVGHQALRVNTAIALDSSRLKGEVLTYRAGTTIPQLRGTGLSLRGGHWAEGWGYGDLAAVGLIRIGKALEEAGLADGVAEREWAGEVAAHLGTACPVPTVSPGAGDYFTYPPSVPGAELRSLIGPIPPPAPLHIANTGLTVVRGPELYASILAANLLNADHQQYAPGHCEVWRGADALCITANNITRNQTIQKTPESNTLCLNSPGLHNYPFSMGVWYGTPGIVTLARQDTPDYHFLAVDCHAAYSNNQAAGEGGPAREWVRYWLAHRRLGFVVTLDRMKLANAECYRGPRWHLSPGAASQAGSNVSADRGASRVQITGLSDGPLTVELGELVGRDAVKVPQVRLVGTPDRTDVSIVSVVQTGPAGAALPVPTFVPGGADIGGVRVVFAGASVTVG